LLLRLYPARWRARYGDEFAALLAERPLGPFDVADVLLGAIDAHLHLRGLGSWSEHRRGFPMSLRLGAYAAIAGGALMLIGLLWSALDAADSDPGIWLFLAGMLALLVALAGLSAFQAREHPALVWAAFLLPAIGGTVTVLGVLAMGLAPDQAIVGDLTGWFFFFIGLLATIAGSILFAAATWATGALPRTGAIVLGGTCAISLLAFVVSIAGGDGMWESLRLLFAFAYLAFPAGWVLFGALALRADRPALAPSPA
ncbi:MAG: hypothetical protein MUE82_11745, partial [Chloroflexi bacterium]|nr:hypothetical protein [Chloroflexota bacterium]